MIFKVLYQKSLNEVPIRENTETLYLEAEDIRDARKKLAKRPYNIEFIQPLTGKYLEYEQKSDEYKLEKI
ncbi:DNA-directed RNA polymerase subunit epsilon [Sporolactobacillus sp. Y61]|jgi:DNA-dependent RNA polymerase auxiliary subunit epsilon|uniref:DNA-directed RNA polymerase subunit epsilon n=1 Tax=Sporolactobacillus sp. Y61 TaxID=3160863 RepID=A0AAU8ICZ8_9BACL|nr:DNA-directed RNA polymerase subunit epsilon [Sporolactobacillus sp. THM19-2]RYL92835.1 DUF1447 family protein [Sporolactobacillus sp. THM19-2]